MKKILENLMSEENKKRGFKIFRVNSLKVNNHENIISIELYKNNLNKIKKGHYHLGYSSIDFYIACILSKEGYFMSNEKLENNLFSFKIKEMNYYQKCISGFISVNKNENTEKVVKKIVLIFNNLIKERFNLNKELLIYDGFHNGMYSLSYNFDFIDLKKVKIESEKYSKLFDLLIKDKNLIKYFKNIDYSATGIIIFQ